MPVIPLHSTIYTARIHIYSPSYANQNRTRTPGASKVAMFMLTQFFGPVTSLGSMKNFWKKTKQSITIGVGKIKDKPKEDDPEYLEAAEKLRSAEKQIHSVIFALQVWSKGLVTLSQSQVELANVWEQVFEPGDDPYHSQAVKSKEGVEGMHEAYTNVSQAHIPGFLIKPLSDLMTKVRELKKAKAQRKNQQLLLKSEEKSLKAAQEKVDKGDPKPEKQEKAVKDLERREERTTAQRAEYEKWHDAFMSGVQDLESKRKQVLKKVFEAHQFYMMEFVELQQAALSERESDFEMEALRGKYPSATSKDVPIEHIAETGDLSDDVSD